MKTLQGRGLVAGKTQGDLIFTNQPIAFLAGVDPDKGVISDPKHELVGQVFTGKVLAFPYSVGSSVGAYVIYSLSKNHTAPAAIINMNSDIITVSGCAISGIPVVDLPDGGFESLRGIKNASVDASKGTVSIV
jgi:hypothetical protein|tara:strand:+ start:4134 stop:4532 length:399 start_codon:yes stop_codon:yes gene_type:complete